jgi:hypothetical protein
MSQWFDDVRSWLAVQDNFQIQLSVHALKGWSSCSNLVIGNHSLSGPPPETLSICLVLKESEVLDIAELGMGWIVGNVCAEILWIQHRSYTWLWATWANFVVCIVVYTSTDGGFPPLYVLENITIATYDCIYRKAVNFLIPYLYSHPFAEIGWMVTLLSRVWALMLGFSIQVGFWNFSFMRTWMNELVNQMILTKILWTDALCISGQNNTAWYSKLFCQVECLCSAMRHRVTWSNSKPGSRLIANCILGDWWFKNGKMGWLGVYSPKAKW